MAKVDEYVATQAIHHGGARAYNPGDPVPAVNVKRHGYDKDGLVAKVGSKAAGDAVPDPDEHEVTDPVGT